MLEINDKTLDHLFALARIDPEKDAAKRQKIITDLGAILNHFEELNEVDTSDTKPLAGGSLLANVSREDEPWNLDQNTDLLIGQFSESENGYLKTPPVF